MFTNGNDNAVVVRHYAWEQIKLMSQVLLQYGARASSASSASSVECLRTTIHIIRLPGIPSSHAQKRHRRETQRSRETRARGRRWRREHPMSPAHHLAHAVRRRSIDPSARLFALPYAEATMYYYSIETVWGAPDAGGRFIIITTTTTTTVS